MQEKEFSLNKIEDTSVLVDYIYNIISEKQNKDDLLILLEGELGSGKTTFASRLAKKLNITEHVISPTYTIANEYELNHELLLYKKLLHIDLYRLKTKEEFEKLNLLEKGPDPKIVIIEWPFEDLLESKTLKIILRFSHHENSRRVKVFL